MSRMLQKISLIFQRLPESPGDSMQHARDMRDMKRNLNRPREHKLDALGSCRACRHGRDYLGPRLSIRRASGRSAFLDAGHI